MGGGGCYITNSMLLQRGRWGKYEEVVCVLWGHVISWRNIWKEKKGEKGEKEMYNVQYNQIRDIN